MISATMFRDSTKQELTEEQEQLKREIYERMNPRRRKFIDRIGYDEWDPFQKPNDPMDIRVDPSKRTTQQLFRGFMHSLGERTEGNDFNKGAARLRARDCEQRRTLPRHLRVLRMVL